MTARLPAVGTLLVVALVALAGCNAVGLSPSPTPTPTGTPTPADTPTSTPTETPVVRQAWPGLSGDGVTEPQKLVRAHSARLRAVSYTYRDVTVYRHDDGRAGHRVTWMAVADGSFNRTVSSTGTLPPGLRSNSSASAYGNGTMKFTRQRVQGTVLYDRVRQRSHPAFPGRSVMLTAFASVNTTVVDVVTRDGTTMAIVRSSSPATARFRGVRASNLTLEATVEASGLVRRLELRYRGEYFDWSGTVERTLVVTDVGETTVTPPDWLPQARANTTGTESRLRGGD